MAENSFRIGNQARPQESKSVFSFLDKLLKVDHWLEDGLPVKYLPHILYVTLLGIFYIGNRHYAEKNIRKMDRILVEVEDLRADYITLKADYMIASKQSEVARKVKDLGLKESNTPPQKIKVKKSEY